MSRNPRATTTHAGVLAVLEAEERASRAYREAQREVERLRKAVKGPPESLRPCEVKDARPGTVVWHSVKGDRGREWFWHVIVETHGEPVEWPSESREGIRYTATDGSVYDSVDAFIEIVPRRKKPTPPVPQENP